MTTTRQTYKVTKAMSDLIFSDPVKVKKALKESIRQARLEKLMLQQLNKETNV